MSCGCSKRKSVPVTSMQVAIEAEKQRLAEEVNRESAQVAAANTKS